MSFASGSFAAFVAATVALYYILPRRAQPSILVVASCAFALSWGWHALASLAFLTIVNYALGLALPARPRWLGAGILVNVIAVVVLRPGGLLGLLLPEVTLGAVPAVFEGGEYLAPVGISFYALASISYLVDVRHGVLPPCRSIIAFALYLGYFPKLLAGPIERGRFFLPQLAQARIVDNDRLIRSTGLIVLGLFRKLVIADSLRHLIPIRALQVPGELPAPMLALWLVAWIVSIYNDFAGYTDIARGVSGIFGIEISRNFATPLYSRSFTELWTRWHISLSMWLRDYVYLPLSRAALRRDPNPQRFAAVWIPPLATMLASGLWHGATPGLMVWGTINGIYLGLERMLARGRPARSADRLPRSQQWVGRLTVLGLTAAGMLTFLMPLPLAFAYARGILSLDPLTPIDFRPLVFLLASGLLDGLQIRSGQELPFLRWPRMAQAAAIAGAALCIYLITRIGVVAPFVYQEF